MAVEVAVAGAADIAELVDVAARTFPLACPPSLTRENIAAFVDENLSAERFASCLDDPERVVLTASVDGRIIGYAMLIRGVADDAIELSKMYVLPERHGGGASNGLMRETLVHAAEMGAKSVWLGVNQRNQRAQRFYTKHGFAITGTRTFTIGEQVENDYVMTREL